MKNVLAYYRVSTNRQGQSGLGLEAQRQSVQDFVRSCNWKLVDELTEIESGRKTKRPVLQTALAQCKKLDAVLLIARLDRLSRNVMFISTLIESKVDFIAIDNPSINPQENPFILHILAAVAQYEQRQISVRTKDALNAARKRGVELGRYGTNVLSKENKKAAIEYALQMEAKIEVLKGKGITTVRGIKKELNRRRVPTYRGAGCRWHNQTVHNVLIRINKNKAENL